MHASSSSLAFALGNPNKRANELVYRPEESGPFFKDFLSRSAQLLENKPIPTVAASAKDNTKTDPLVHPVNSLPTSIPESSVTPRKRKPPKDPRTPPSKRVQADAESRSPTKLVSDPPARPSPDVTQKSASRKVLAYVNVPSPLRKLPSKKQSVSSAVIASDESEDGEGSNALFDPLSGLKSSTRRTGDRDERGNL